MKVLKLRDNVTVVFDNGNAITETNCSEELYLRIIETETEEEMLALLKPKAAAETRVKSVMEQMVEGGILSQEADGVVTWPEVSDLIMPYELVRAITEAFEEDDPERMTAYKNFWKLCSLNPNAEARKNLFWFLDRYGMTISKSGMFTAYRNAVPKGTAISPEQAAYVSNEWADIKFRHRLNPADYFVFRDSDEDLDLDYEYHRGHYEMDEIVGNLQELYEELSSAEVETGYTDAHSHSTDIRIGQFVNMPRNRCDEDSHHTCSRGLHVAGKDWLRDGYYGGVTFMVLVNPANVVAVPPLDDYGKMRCCEYLPVMVVERDTEGKIIPPAIQTGFDDTDLFGDVIYEGAVSQDNSFQQTLADGGFIDNYGLHEAARQAVRRKGFDC